MVGALDGRRLARLRCPGGIFLLDCRESSRLSPAPFAAHGVVEALIRQDTKGSSRNGHVLSGQSPTQQSHPGAHQRSESDMPSL